LSTTTAPVACDIETTGLNFRKDKIMSIAFSTKEGNWVVPVEHKDSPFSYEETSTILAKYIRPILENPSNKKIFHNAKFDLKFLIREGVAPVNVYDTKVMHHLINENMPKSLMDLVKLYFPNELENL